ncbi:MAG: DUF2281 domain-containing protein [Chromatiales bacterium]|nr:DUF2281 domain-containing protein [Chromatiales bacterium]
MNLPETIYAHAQTLPVELQREALDFIDYLQQRYRGHTPASLNTESFIAQVAGTLGDDFPDDIDDADLGNDAPREPLP